MYSTCLFCNQSLGANEVVEAFPVGRRLAFDQRRGRLWVVCRKCEKWNLTPLEERWEAIERCERLFRDTRKRVSTDNIGLAKLPEGLELVRIGEPLRREFAAWRYGTLLQRRSSRWMTGIAAGGAVYGAAVGGGAVYTAAVGAGAVGVTAGGCLLASWIVLCWGRATIRDRRVIARIRDTSGFVHPLRVRDAHRTSIDSGDEPYTWVLRLNVGLQDWDFVLKGDDARRIAAKVVPHINTAGAFEPQIAEAVKHIDESGGPEPYLAWVARYSKNTSFMRGQWLGVEMAVNEENERVALEGELALLELAWKEAEEIAAIADDLVLPAALDAQLHDLKAEVQSPRGTHRKAEEAI